MCKHGSDTNLAAMSVEVIDVAVMSVAAIGVALYGKGHW